MSTKTEGNPTKGEFPEWGAVCEVTFLGSLKRPIRNQCLYFGNGKWGGTEGRVYYSDHVTHWRLIQRESDPLGETVVPGIVAARTIAELQAAVRREQTGSKIVDYHCGNYYQRMRDAEEKVGQQAAEIERLENVKCEFQAARDAARKERDELRAEIARMKPNEVSSEVHTFSERLPEVGKMIDYREKGKTAWYTCRCESPLFAQSSEWRYATLPIDSAKANEIRESERHDFARKILEQRDTLRSEAKKYYANGDKDRIRSFTTWSNGLNEAARIVLGLEHDDPMPDSITETPIGTSEPEQLQFITTWHPLSGAVAVDDAKPSDSAATCDVEGEWPEPDEDGWYFWDDACTGPALVQHQKGKWYVRFRGTEDAYVPSREAASAWMRERKCGPWKQRPATCERCELLKVRVQAYRDAVRTLVKDTEIMESEGTE